MSIPKITETPGVINFNFEDEKLTIKVKRLHSHSDGTVKGELIILTTANGYNSHLKQALFNFAVDRTRKEWATSMKQIYPDCDWGNIFEALCVKVLEIVRRFGNFWNRHRIISFTIMRSP